jgi:hypothetical protein
VVADPQFLARVNGFADVLVKLDSLCRQPIRIKMKIAWLPKCQGCSRTAIDGKHCSRHALNAKRIRDHHRRLAGTPLDAPLRYHAHHRPTRQASRTSHYSYLTSRVPRVMRVRTKTGRKERTVLMPVSQIGPQLIALGLNRQQLWPAKKRQLHNHGRKSRSFWNRHNEYELAEILEHARRGWMQQQQQAHPRTHGEPDEESKLLNMLWQNVERLFANHGIYLNG